MKKNYIEGFFNNIVRPEFQVIMFLITALIVFFMGSRALHRFRPLENYPELESITPEKVREWSGDPIVVEVGLFIRNWHLFKIVENDFIVNGVVWFQFDPALISLDVIGNFSFLKGELLQKSDPITKLIDGKLFAEYKIRLRFTTTLNHAFFPLDDHSIFIILVNTHVTPSEVVFRSYKSDFEMAKRIQTPAWRQVGRSVKTGYSEESFDKFDEKKSVRYPQVIFEIDFMRSGVSLILLIFLPIFLIFFLSLFWFSLEPNEGKTIMALTTSAITSSIAYRFVIQNMSPSVGYFLLSDHIFTYFLALSFASFVLALVWIRRGSMSSPMIIIRGVAFLLFHVTFICIWYFLLFMWI